MTEWTKVLVCGGRDFSDAPTLYERLDEFHAQWPIHLLICGGQKGADYFAAHWADMNAVQRAIFDVTRTQWRVTGRKAGPIRNRMMLLLNPLAVIAFPTGGPGTGGMIEAARLAGVAKIQIHQTRTPRSEERGV